MNFLMDEDASGTALCAALDSIGYLNIVKARDCNLAGKGDEKVVKTAARLNKIVVTANISDLNEVKTPPCTGHGGIIVFNNNDLKPDYVVPRIKALKALSFAEKIKRHVTKVFDTHI